MKLKKDSAVWPFYSQILQESRRKEKRHAKKYISMVVGYIAFAT
jgi:hypothetical protein